MLIQDFLKEFLSLQDRKYCSNFRRILTNFWRGGMSRCKPFDFCVDPAYDPDPWIFKRILPLRDMDSCKNFAGSAALAAEACGIRVLLVRCASLIGWWVLRAVCLCETYLRMFAM